MEVTTSKILWTFFYVVQIVIFFSSLLKKEYKPTLINDYEWTKVTCLLTSTPLHCV